MNQEHWLTLKLQSPLCIGLYKTARFMSTKDEIPGSVLRGTFARYIEIEKGTDHIFEYVSNMRFGFFRPSHLEDAISLPLPLTAEQCKRKPNFKEEGHGVFDFLLPFIAYEEIGGGAPWSVFDVPFTFSCQVPVSDGKKCGSRMEKATGYYIRKNREFKKVEIPHTSQTKVSINRRTRAGKEGMLYSTTGISPGTVFSGRVWCPEAYVGELRRAIEHFGVGALTGRGFGDIKVIKNENAGIIGRVSDRIQQFNEKLVEVWKDISSLTNPKNIFPEPEATYFTVDLLSPAILRYPIPTTRLILEIGGVEYEPAYWFTRPTFVGGWSPALGLPKGTHLGADMGSTYVFKAALDVDTLQQSLETLELNGVGFRTDEGYGEVMICHPFHLEVMPV